MWKTGVHLFLTVWLTACGGGGDAGTGNAAIGAGSGSAKYVGSWAACTPTGDPLVQGARLVFTFASTGSSSASYTLVATGHTAADCSSSALSTITESGTVTIDGTALAEGKLVEKITTTDTTGVVEKDIVFFSTNQFQLGNDAPVDAQGYPTTLSAQFVFTRQ